jgi:hypothetical protein
VKALLQCIEITTIIGQETNKIKLNNMKLNKIYKEINEIGTYTAPNDTQKKRLRELIALIPISKYDRVR